MTSRLNLRAARADERATLEALQWRASTHLATYRDALLAAPDAIELPAELIVDGDVRVAERDGAVLGFSVVLGVNGGACELDGLFVEPALWRAGIGRALVADAVSLARARGAARIDVTANPDALRFYAAVGFVAGVAATTRFGLAPRMHLRLQDFVA